MTGWRATWAFLVAAWTAVGPVAGQDEPQTEDWGPQTGDVTWSLREHALTWTTPRLELTLDPWITFRHVLGTTASVAEQEGTEPWDNLRGAQFEARLDGVWEVSGSLEEWQGIPSAWNAMWMTEASTLPGWGRAKTTSGGRADVARARGHTVYRHVGASGDTLTWTGAYAPASWGKMPSALTFSSEAASFPQVGVVWARSNDVYMGLTAARWTGTERSPQGGSTESLFRQSDALWAHAQRRFEHAEFGILAGAARELPWTSELAADSSGRFGWKAWTSVQGSWRLPGTELQLAGEWASHQGGGVALRSPASRTACFTVSAIRLAARAASTPTLLNAGTPVADVLRPAGLEEAAWRVEVLGRYRLKRMAAGGRAAAVAEARVAEVWVTYELQGTWPLHATLGAEMWTVPNHPTLPRQGARLRVGLAHRFGLTTGSTTFEAP